jgi:hypothetical protein
MFWEIVGRILLSESNSDYPPVFLAIRQYFWLSASISGYPPVFLAIRQYFRLSASNNDSNTEVKENFVFN